MTEFGQVSNQDLPSIERIGEIPGGATEHTGMSDGSSEQIVSEPSHAEILSNTGQEVVGKLGGLGTEVSMSKEMSPKEELSEIQKQNDTVMKELIKHFPKAFIEGTTRDGRKYGVLKDPLEDDQTTPLKFHKVISPNGIVEVGVQSFDGFNYSSGSIDASRLMTITRCLDFAPILDGETDTSGRTSSIDINAPEGEAQHSLSAVIRRRVDFSDPYLDLLALNKMFVRSERIHESDPVPNGLGTDGIIAALTMSENEAQFK